MIRTGHGSCSRRRRGCSPGTPIPGSSWRASIFAAEPSDYCAAYEAFNEAYTLDPRSSRWVPGGPLDVSRDEVNAGACES